MNDLDVSIIIPVRNESGTIYNIMKQLPDLGKKTELIFVEGNSTDNTWEEIEENYKIFKEKREIKFFKQKGRGKGDAVRLGFEKASGDILIIYDGDMSVPATEIKLFFEAIKNKKNVLINGSRFIFPMEKRAMRSLNYIANKLFGIVFKWICKQNITDTLCGTKVLRKDDYEKIKGGRSYFGYLDPFGDFDLLLGSAKLKFQIIEVPVHYRERVYGTTNINRWNDGWLLIKMTIIAIVKMKIFSEKNKI